MMRKQIRKMTGSLLVVGLLATGLTTGAAVYAANTDTGAAGASAKTEYSLKEMLAYALEDEYLAQTEYDVVMDAYGVQKPFSNIIKAEATHISLLTPLFEEYDVTLPEKDWESLVTKPESVEAAYAIGVEAEEKNIAMYESFLKATLPDDVRDVFEVLKNASERHLTAFQRQVDGVACGTGVGKGSGIGKGTRNGRGTGNCTGDGSCTGTGMQASKGKVGTGGNGQGNRNTAPGSCIIE